MDDADVKKLYSALAITVNLEAQLTNFQSRGGRAGKAWTAWLKATTVDPPQKAQMKEALTALSSLAKTVKVVLKDLDKTTKDANKTTLAKYSTGKEYRDKVLSKQLASVRAWDKDCNKFMTSIAKVVPPFRHPNDKAVDEKATYTAVQNFLHYYDEMSKGLAKLG
jgi:hypothetical protein